MGLASAHRVTNLLQGTNLDDWEFIQRDGAAWYWRHTNAAGVTRESTVSFEREIDCIGNAIYHGYVPRLHTASEAQQGAGHGGLPASFFHAS